MDCLGSATMLGSQGSTTSFAHWHLNATQIIAKTISKEGLGKHAGVKISPQTLDLGLNVIILTLYKA
jgi:hypothetical protein